MKDNVPLVSICCITYNHSKYIQKCLDGFVEQKTDFIFEILIHDDGSNDGTREIIEEFQERYPNIIKPIFQSENQWSKGVRGINYRYNFPRANGKYIALCEGDDYWTDPFKLQKQVDFLEANPGYSLCFHKSSVIMDDIQQFVLPSINENKSFIINDIITESNFIRTESMVFRKSVIDNMEILFVYAGDLFLSLLCASKGKVYFISETMSVYRMHDKGFYSGSSSENVLKRGIEDRIKLNKYFEYKYNIEFRRAIKKRKRQYYLVIFRNSLISRIYRKIKKICRSLITRLLVFIFPCVFLYK